MTKPLSLLLAFALAAFLAFGLEGAARSSPISPVSPEDDVWTQAELEAVSEEIRAQVEALRGREFVRDVAVRVMDKDGLQQVMLDEIDEEYGDGQIEGLDSAAKLLGLLPPGTSLMEATLAFVREQVGGFYLPGTDTFYLMESFTGGVAKVILSHELTHALDDQLFDLDTAMKSRVTNSDAVVAYKALVEGAAMVVMTQWAGQHVVDGEISMADMQNADPAMTESLEEAPRYLWLPLIAPYMAGMQFLARADSILGASMKIGSSLNSGERIPIDEVYANPPRSTEQILHPDKYWDPAQLDEPREIEFALEGDVPAGWEILYEDVLGELVLAILVRPFDDRGGISASPTAMMGIEYTNAIAEGWGGDRFALLGKGDERFLRLVTLWDTPRDAAEFYGAMHSLLPDLEEQLKAVAELEVSTAKSRRRTLELDYGESDDEVVLTIAYGSRKGVVADVRAALAHRETPGLTGR